MARTDFQEELAQLEDQDLLERLLLHHKEVKDQHSDHSHNYSLAHQVLQVTQEQEVHQVPME